MTEPVRVVRAGELRPAEGTAAMHRKSALDQEGLWAGTVVTDAGMDSGWHHHGDNSSVIYVLRGRIRIDFGPGGGESVEGSDGDFILVPPRSVHRETTPGEPVHGVVFRAGSGQILFNVDGPEPED